MSIIPIILESSDIHNFGHTSYHDGEGFLHINCDGNTFRTDVIFIRSILQHLGYKILSTEEYYVDQTESCDMEIATNMPWNVYENLN